MKPGSSSRRRVSAAINPLSYSRSARIIVITRSASSSTPSSSSSSSSFSTTSTSSSSASSSSSTKPSTTSTKSSTTSTVSSTSSSSSTKWKRPIKEGINPAYDAALTYLSSYQTKTLSKLSALQTKLASASEEDINSLREKIDQLEIEAYINDPAVRYEFKNTAGSRSMDRPVMRTLAKAKWIKQGGRDIIMGRIYQNRIVPDLLEDCPPSLPLTLSIKTSTGTGTGNGSGNSVGNGEDNDTSSSIEPGLILPTSKFTSAPTLTFQPFEHPSTPSTSNPNPTANYTLLVVSPDEPNSDTASYTERIHYLKTDIPLSVTTGDIDLFTGPGNEVFKWEPPAPAKGAGRQRYVFLLLRQNIDNALSTMPTSRANFRLRQFMRSNTLSPRSISAVHLFRAEWTVEEKTHIDTVWREYRQSPTGAPEYEQVELSDRMVRPLSAQQKRADQIRQRAWERAVEKAGGYLLGGGLPELNPGLANAIESVVERQMGELEQEQRDEDGKHVVV
ncbi:phosphatidylethanolamine-binding protein [Naematelia encephala]|uniref:Phosphatidylethanolamine-binding protein n=1 Tax=Naematelia encephala TaxID=71784 RepID=A0A1Y2B9X0_9TREE|nr:phosphatidylethanolamine-binding protein [Naematelia encephala]